MKSTLHIALASAVLLITSCSPAPEATAPAAPKTPPAQEQPKAEPAKAPGQIAPAPSQANAPAPALADLGKVLGAIKDGPTAQAAKGGLDALVQQLSAAKTAAAAGTENTLGGLGKLATDAAAKAGLSPDIMNQITGLLANPAVKAVIGPTLEKLQGLLK